MRHLPQGLTALDEGVYATTSIMHGVAYRPYKRNIMENFSFISQWVREIKRELYFVDDTKVIFKPIRSGRCQWHGMYFSRENIAYIDPRQVLRDMHFTIAHELRHAWQHRTGVSTWRYSDNPKESPQLIWFNGKTRIVFTPAHARTYAAYINNPHEQDANRYGFHRCPQQDHFIYKFTCPQYLRPFAEPHDSVQSVI